MNVLSPAGGKVGTTFEVMFTGTEVEQPQALLFNHPGIKATPLHPPIPPPDPKAKVDPKKPIEPPPITKFTVTIGNDVPLGYYDARLVNKFGISNPRRFVVGDLNEIAEKEPNNDVEQAQKVAIPCTINGVILTGTDVDYFSFSGKKGQRILITCLTASIDSRLDPELKVFSPQGAGNRLCPAVAAAGWPRRSSGLARGRRLPDSPEQVHLHRLGSAEYFYRLNVTTAPHIDAVFPPMVEPGKTAQITLFGRNLPGGKPDPTAVDPRPSPGEIDGEPSRLPGECPAVQDQLQFYWGWCIPSWRRWTVSSIA